VGVAGPTGAAGPKGDKGDQGDPGLTPSGAYLFLEEGVNPGSGWLRIGTMDQAVVPDTTKKKTMLTIVVWRKQ